RTVVVQDVWQREAPTYKRYTPYRVSVNAEIAVPLWRGDEVIGVIDLGSSTPGAFWEDDRLWLEQAMAPLRYVPSPGTGLGERLSKMLASGKDIGKALDTILRSALELTGLAEAYAAIVLDDGDWVVPRRAWQVRPGRSEWRDPAGKEGWSKRQGVTGRALGTGEVSVTPDVTQEHNYLEHLPDVLSEIVVPVRGPGGEVIGALDIQAMKKNAFRKQIVEQLRELAQAVSPTLYLAYLAREREQEQHVLTQLASVAGAATKKLSSQHVYDEILQTARKLLPDARMYSLLR